MCGGVCGPRNRRRDLFADRHVPAGDAGGIVRGVIGFYYGKTTAEFDGAESQPAMILHVSTTITSRVRCPEHSSV
jgi:hypothetical protein